MHLTALVWNTPVWFHFENISTGWTGFLFGRPLGEKWRGSNLAMMVGATSTGIQAGRAHRWTFEFLAAAHLCPSSRLCVQPVTALNPLLRYSVPESDPFSLVLRCRIAPEGKLLSETMGQWNARSFFMKTVWRTLSERNETLATSVFLGTRVPPPLRNHWNRWLHEELTCDEFQPRVGSEGSGGGSSWDSL